MHQFFIFLFIYLFLFILTLVIGLHHRAKSVHHNIYIFPCVVVKEPPSVDIRKGKKKKVALHHLRPNGDGFLINRPEVAALHNGISPFPVLSLPDLSGTFGIIFFPLIKIRAGCHTNSMVTHDGQIRDSKYEGNGSNHTIGRACHRIDPRFAAFDWVEA